jgi:formylmethanofuran dehydrogenase subunit E
LDFYRKHNLPIPRKHPDIRHLERMKLRNPRKLFDRKCDKCWTDMKSTYDKNREEIVYCKKCYEKEIY